MARGTGVFRPLAVVMFFGASSLFNNARASTVVTSSQQVPEEISRKSKNAVAGALHEHGRGKRLEGVAHSEHQHHLSGSSHIRGLSSTRCIEGQSFTVKAPARPEIEGCYSESGDGRMPDAHAGEYAYTSSERDERGVGTHLVLAIAFDSEEFHEGLHWALVAPAPPQSHENTTLICTSVQKASHFSHPTEGSWICSLSANMSDVAVATPSEFSATCGCSGPARSRFDLSAQYRASAEASAMKYSVASPQRTSPSAFWMFWVMASGLGLLARCSTAQRRTQIARAQQEVARQEVEMAVRAGARRIVSSPSRSERETAAVTGIAAAADATLAKI